MSTPHTPRVIFNPPVFPGDENKTRQAYYLSFIVGSGIVTMVLILMTRLRHGEGWLGTSVLVLSATAVVLLVAWLVAKRGAVQLASYITIRVLSLASTFVAVARTGSGALAS